jgi:hypothetical protein
LLVPSGFLQRITLFMVAIAVGVAAACTASFPVQPSTPAPLVDLVIRYSTDGVRLVKGSTSFSPRFLVYTIDAEGVYVDVSNRVVWSVSNPQVLTLPGPFSFPSGSFLLGQAGATEIYATYQGLVASLPVLVRDTPPYPYLEMTTFRSQVNLFVGPTSSFRQDVTSSVTWTTSNEKVMRVDAKGQLTPGVPGNVEIRASFNGLSDSYWTSTPPRSR